MFAAVAEIACGDVVACGPSVFVVQELSNNGEMTLLRIEHQGSVRHRADVTPDHWTDLAASGLPLQDVVVRCVPLKRYGKSNVTKLGTLSDRLRRRIALALKREQLVRKFEDSPSMQSNLLASTSSRGRRVGAVRYA
jgi:hypothetical protein